MGIQDALRSKYRRLTRPWLTISILFTSIAIVASVIHTFNIRPFGFVLLGVSYLYLLFALFLPLCFLWIPASKKITREGVPWYDILLATVSFVIPLYASLHTVDIILSGWAAEAPPEAFALAILLWLVLIEAARRAGGTPFAAVVFIFSVYPLFAGFAPGVFASKNFSLPRVACFHIYGEDSVLGIPLHVFGRLVFAFLVFAIAIQSTGAGKFFNDVATSLVGAVRGGSAKVSIVASCLFGTISGATVANVLTTGTFTIPAMKRDGFSPEFAAAVEATASTGGPLIPPVMGATAFIMAEFLGISYATVALAAVVPALLYFFAMFMQIDAYAAKNKLKKSYATIAEAPPLRQVFFNNLHIIICFFVLVYLLFFERLEAWAPWIATALLFVLAMFRRQSRLGPQDFVRFLENVGRTLGDLMGVFGAIGMIIGSFVLSGVAFALPFTIVDLAGENTFLMLICGAIASFILGMGVSMSACYIFLAIALAPGLVMAGLDQMAVHLFVLYFAAVSYITPPVALGAFAAAALAGSDPVKTGYKAMRLGIVIFIVPFFFVMNPALILRGPPLEILQGVGTCVLGLIFIAGSLEGYMWRIGKINMPIRILLFIAGLLIAHPNTMTDIWGAALAAVVLGFCFLERRLGRS